MANTGHSTMRRVLRREIAGTIGLLTDEHDFRAMRRYRTFTFQNHTAYLREVEALLKSLAAQGNHTTVALFDPEEYAEFCAATGLDPDAPSSRTRFTAELATTGPTVPYDGQPLAELLPHLVDEAVRQATWEYAATLLARIGACASCGEDIGRAAFARASNLLVRILDTAPRGNRHLVCSVTTPAETLVAVLHADDDSDGRDRTRRGRNPRIHHGPGSRPRHPEPRRPRHAHHRPRHHRPHLRLAPARRRRRAADRRRGLRRLLHRRRIGRPHLPGTGRRLLRTPRPRRREPTTGHAH